VGSLYNKKTKKFDNKLLMENLMIATRKIYNDHALLIWESVAEDPVFPIKENIYRNHEIFGGIFKTVQTEGGDVKTMFYSVCYRNLPISKLVSQTEFYQNMISTYLQIIKFSNMVWKSLFYKKLKNYKYEETPSDSMCDLADELKSRLKQIISE